MDKPARPAATVILVRDAPSAPDRIIVTVAGAITAFRWSPDGRSLAFTADVDAPVQRMGGPGRDLRQRPVQERRRAVEQRRHRRGLKAEILNAGIRYHQGRPPTHERWGQ